MLSRIWRTQKGFVIISTTMFDCVIDDNVDDDDEACRRPQGCIWGLKSEEAYSPAPPSLPPLEMWRNTVENTIWKLSLEKRRCELKCLPPLENWRNTVENTIQRKKILGKQEVRTSTPPSYSTSRKLQNTIANTFAEKHLRQILFATTNIQCPEDKEYQNIQSYIV